MQRNRRINKDVDAWDDYVLYVLDEAWFEENEAWKKMMFGIHWGFSKVPISQAFFFIHSVHFFSLNYVTRRGSDKFIFRSWNPKLINFQNNEKIGLWTCDGVMNFWKSFLQWITTIFVSRKFGK